jgi:hypothetical protein
VGRRTVRGGDPSRPAPIGSLQVSLRPVCALAFSAKASGGQSPCLSRQRLLALRPLVADRRVAIKIGREGIAFRASRADAFTIGAAAIEGSYAPRAGPLAAQFKAVLADCAAG